MIQNQTTIKPNKFIGSLKINYVVLFYMTIILITPAYTYYMAVSQQQQKPFPHSTVTGTACHYPQAIIFRWTMTSGAGFLALMMHVVFRFYEKQAIKYQYPGSTYSYMYWPTILSVIGYMGAIATIDIGGTGTIHGVGAVYFFICQFFLVVNITIISKKMRQWDTRFMKKLSLLQKIIVAGYLCLIFIYCLIGLLLQAISSNKPNDDDIYIVIIQWNLVYAGLIWMLCFVGDMKNVSLVLNDNKQKQFNMLREGNLIKNDLY